MGKKAYAWAESDVLEFHFREALTELSELLECIKEYKAKGDDACLGFIDRHGLATKVEHVYHRFSIELDSQPETLRKRWGPFQFTRHRGIVALALFPRLWSRTQAS